MVKKKKNRYNKSIYVKWLNILTFNHIDIIIYFYIYFLQFIIIHIKQIGQFIRLGFYFKIPQSII